jgi:hypothetical protein
MDQQPLTFPQGFLWGTATAAHPVEGDNTNNDWWAFEQRPGAIWHDDRSGLACDWWRNAERDFDLMAEMGHNSHRTIKRLATQTSCLAQLTDCERFFPSQRCSGTTSSRLLSIWAVAPQMTTSPCGTEL